MNPFEITFAQIRSADIDCCINYQYDETKGLYYTLRFPEIYEPNNYVKKFINLIHKMNTIQRQFFAEPINVIDETSFYNNYQFLLCPGNNIYKLFFQNESKSTISPLKEKEKLYIMKWIFSIACSIKILISNNFDPIFLNDNSIFIDSKMNARYLYDIWKVKIMTTNAFLKRNFYLPPEYYDDDFENSKDFEKSCSYSLGILILSLLNQKPPCSYFKLMCTHKVKFLIKTGQTFQGQIPDCNLKILIQNLINVNPNERKDIDYAINYLIDEKNCLEGADYKEFRNFIYQKFKIDHEIDDSELISVIKNNLEVKIDLNSKPEVHYEKLKLSDFSNFLKLASDTTYEKVFENEINQIIDNLKHNLPNELKEYYQKNETEQNKFNLMEFCLEHMYDEEVDLDSF